MNTIDIWGKGALEYVADALARFNRGVDGLTVRAISGNVSKGMEIAYILDREFGVQVDSIEMRPIRLDRETCRVDIALKADTTGTQPTAADYRLSGSRFIDFPLYHLLFDWWLFEERELQLLHHNTPLITVERDGTVRYGTNKEGTKNRVRAALCRCGYLWPSNWRQIARRLSEFDDVILGLDTNILYNCTVSEHLLPALSLINSKKYTPTPNWVLFVIPNGVIHELEEAANLRDRQGLLHHGGRMGFRALQEVIELNQNIDMPGVSLLVVGEADPALDTRIELQGLRADLRKSRQHRSQRRRSQQPKNQQPETQQPETQRDVVGGVFRSRKSSSGDMIIRSQLKTFLRQLDFHKGAYFLTADKSNAALARAEGLCPIYVRPPSKTPRIRWREGDGWKQREEMRMRVPIGKLVYDMAVEFRPLTIRRGDQDIKVKCDPKGEMIDHWVHKNLEIEREGLERLQGDYQGKFGLRRVRRTWRRLTRELVGWEE